MLRPATHRRTRGFTLIELLISVAVVAILARIALPSFFDTIRKSRRSDAVAAISMVQQAEERYRANNTSYGTHFIVSSGTFTGVGVAADTNAATTYTTSNGYYQLSFPDPAPTSTSYTIRATALGSQANDTNCKYMDMSVSGGNLSYLSGSTTSTTTDNSKCWKR